MKPAKDIDTPLTKKCKTWEELKEQGVSKDGIIYLPIGVTTGNLKIAETKSFKDDAINQINKNFINIEKLKEDETSKLSTNPFSEEEEN
jgi:hypothetical protein